MVQPLSECHTTPGQHPPNVSQIGEADEALNEIAPLPVVRHS
jgi:hypothetical protein